MRPNGGHFSSSTSLPLQWTLIPAFSARAGMVHFQHSTSLVTSHIQQTAPTSSIYDLAYDRHIPSADDVLRHAQLERPVSTKGSKECVCSITVTGSRES